MKKKEILIILTVVILAVISCVTTYMIVNSHEESFTTLRVSNSCTIEVPNSENSFETLEGDISKYTFKSHNLTISYQKSDNNSEIKSLKDKQIENSSGIETHIYSDDESGIYTAFIENENGEDALLITCDDLDYLKAIVDSINFTNPEKMNITVEDNDTTSTVSETTSSSSDDSTDSSANSYSSKSYTKTNKTTQSTSSSEKTSEEKSSDEIEVSDDVVISFK